MEPPAALVSPTCMCIHERWQLAQYDLNNQPGWACTNAASMLLAGWSAVHV